MAVGITDEIQPRPVAGVRIGVAELGGRTRPRADLTLVELAPGSTCVAVFTQSAFCAAPVTVAKEHLATADARYWLINAGNANAGTGRQGVADARATCKLVAGLSGCKSEQVLPFSTGVIGEFMDLDKFEAALPTAYAGLGRDNWEAGGRAIMTTDTVAKAFSTRFEASGVEYGVTGIAKGSGMIRPDMATMLAFVATDARIGTDTLEDVLAEAVSGSFNRVTVDGDTSTNDACGLAATGGAGGEDLATDAAAMMKLRAAVNEVCRWLAHALVRDGEGATKFVTVKVEGGASEKECLDVAYSIAHSPLVKTALFASDPNWGRLVMAVGKAGVVDLDQHRVNLFLDDVSIVRNGQRAAEYREEDGQRVFDQKEITLRVELGRGNASECVWTSDFSHEYVRINAEYRT